MKDVCDISYKECASHDNYTILCIQQLEIQNEALTSLTIVARVPRTTDTDVPVEAVHTLPAVTTRVRLTLVHVYRRRAER